MTSVLYRAPAVVYPKAVTAQGMYISDDKGKRYLDMSGGAAVSCLGHAHPDVVDAVREKKFAVYAIETIDEAIEILTGRTAGRRGDDGEFPAESVNRKVEKQLIRYAKQRKHFAEDETRND